MEEQQPEQESTPINQFACRASCCTSETLFRKKDNALTDGKQCLGCESPERMKLPEDTCLKPRREITKHREIKLDKYV